MMPGKRWTQEEVEFLQDNWGVKPIPKIVKKLNRTPTAIECKALSLKLGPTKEANEYITAIEVARMMGIDKKAVYKWIAKYGLNAKKKIVSRKKKLHLVTMPDLVKWLKANPDKWDSRKVDLYALGEEQPWLIEKRKLDRDKKCTRYWTTKEVMIAIHMRKTGFTHKKIAERLGRTWQSVANKLYKIEKKERSREKAM